MPRKRKTRKQKIKRKEEQEKMIKQANDEGVDLPQKDVSNGNNMRNDNKCKSILLNMLKWIIGAFLIPIILIIVEFIIPILSKKTSPVSPSLDASRSTIHVDSVYYYAEILEDNNTSHYFAFQEGQIGRISINLTNNDESTLVVNDIYLNVLDYHPVTDIKLSEGIWGDIYSDPVYYGVQLENLCKEYKCTLLDRKSAENFWSHYELPIETNLKAMGEQIGYNETDEIEIIFLPRYPGIYRFKIIIDYSIRNFNDRIESDEFEFILLDPNFIS